MSAKLNLLPCPFSKGSATLLSNRIACDCCLCDMARHNGASDAELAAAWNRRASSPAAVPEGALPPLPKFMRSHIERAINEAENPKGMSLHDGMARLNVGYLRRLLILADATHARAAVEADRAQRPENLDHLIALKHIKSMAAAGHSHDAIYDQACSAIEADRAQQGEPVASIEEDLRFQCQLYHYVAARMKLWQGTATEAEATDAFRELIAHIDSKIGSRRAAPVPDPTAGEVEKAGEIARIKDQRDRLLAFIQNAGVSSGVCCCGDSMERHGNPMDSGHNPVDMWDHGVACWTEEIAESDNTAAGKS
ncbi:hypothetical protein [Massilia sp. UBA6681]|uniref:hypothetical protein n=1 Tax=Massilia sp. UBA6681 TaxID=1946839 RepID=UPI0025BCF172|nr:hypothetical protein [Massilia sp. UBA6681]